MSHPGQRDFFKLVKTLHPDRFQGVKVLEVGSLDINGSIRQYFECAEYVGVDLDQGQGVDLVKEGQLLDFPSRSFDVVASAECFEHNPYWAETFINMLRMMRDDGMIIFSCASYGRGEHGTPRTTSSMSPFMVDAGWAYYRNLCERDFGFLDLSRWLKSWVFFESRRSNDLLFVGFGLSSGHLITGAFMQDLRKITAPTMRGTMMRSLNMILGHRRFQGFYVFVRKHALFLLKHRPITT